MSSFKSIGLMLAIAFFAFALASCTQEQVVPQEENLAFSSNGPSIADPSVGGDETFYKFKLKNGKPVWSNSGTYWLGIIADEKVREIYVYAPGKHSKWMRVDPQFGDLGTSVTFDPDAFLRNGSNCGLFNSDKSGLNAFAVGPMVYVTYGKKYGALRVDPGSVFRENGSTCGSLPDGISCVDYLPFPRTQDFWGSGVFIGVDKDGYVAGSRSIDGSYQVPGIELGTPNSNSDVNYNWQTAGEVSCLQVTGRKSVRFTLDNGDVIMGFAQRGGNEFIKVD